jgi:hypothetical protein
MGLKECGIDINTKTIYLSSTFCATNKGITIQKHSKCGVALGRGLASQTNEKVI